MKLDKAYRRDKKRNQRKHGMRTSGKSVFIIQEQLIKRANKEGAK